MDKNIESLAKLIKKSKKIVFFTGAGISTSAGIPDFRSPETGLYSNLEKLKLPYAEAVFDIDYFEKNPKAFYTLADELYPGKFVPTRFHYFMKLVDKKKKLLRVYTQNIDTLERIAGITDDAIIEAHGSFANNHCIDCHAEMDTATLKFDMNDKSKNCIPRCRFCKGYVKPDIVFFGEALPEIFHSSWETDGDDLDLAIVAGTSLVVHPFASLPAEVSKKADRVLINREKCGCFKHDARKSDLIILSDCDSIADKLSEELGWKEELEDLIEKGNKAKEQDKLWNFEAVREKLTAKEESEILAQKIEESEKYIVPEETTEKEDITRHEENKSHQHKGSDETVEKLTSELENIELK
ncbi:hypothetical protein BVG19_g694 [[Candida] boidinii]|nr:hypothetical protein BVG19_g694 [[Candida] boidinii]OWB49298.1 hypothetical protein B5S27_g838 [[Candida] boidinii]